MTCFQKKLIFIGDSLTQRGWDPEKNGWLAQLGNFYIRQFEIINRGFSGYNTKWVQPIVDDVITSDFAPCADQVELITLWFGSNDGAEPASQQHVPVEDYRRNLISMIEKLRAVPRKTQLPMLLVTPPPTYAPAWEKYFRGEMQVDNQRRESNYIKQYADVVRELGLKFDIPVLDLWVEGGFVPEVEDQFVDGLHFSKKGNDIVYELLMKVLGQHFPHLEQSYDKWEYPTYTVHYGK